MRVADYIAKALADHGVKDMFIVTGGGAMHLNDAFAKETRIRAVFNHHEQASAIAAEGYARVKGSLGVINVTTGPGGLNALNGVFGAWTDSFPMVVVSGQVKKETLMASYPDIKLRQLGDQEVDIVSIVKPITKYATLLMDPKRVRYEIEKVIHLAQSGRPGPCWLDVPVDVQGTKINPDELEAYVPEPESHNEVADMKAVREVFARLQAAERPVFLVGNGVRIGHAVEPFLKLAKRLQIPVCGAWFQDYLASDNPLYCGIQGSVGDRAGNFVVQNSDCLCIIGARMNIRQLSYNWKSFARHAYKIQVDIDPTELNKPTLRADLPISMDARRFVEALDGLGENWKPHANHPSWLKWAQERKRRYYPVVLERHRKPAPLVNSYHFVETLFKHLDSRDIIVSGDGTAAVVGFTAATIKDGQRFFSNSGCASMGYDVPAAIGAAVAEPSKRVICLAGDGSIQMNIQELQTIAHHKMNLKIFVINNGGYLSIRSTQKNFFGRLFGEGPTSGVTFPDMVKLGAAYGLSSMRIEGPNFEAAVEKALKTPGPVIAEVFVDPEQLFEPKLSSRQLPDGRMVSSPLEDMAPFLDRKEFAENMIVPLAEESKGG